RAHTLIVAHDNAPRDFVLSGRAVLVEAASRTARRLGMRVVKVATDLVVPAAEFARVRNAWRAALEAADVRMPPAPVMSSITVRPIGNARSAMADALSSSVRFRQAVVA